MKCENGNGTQSAREGKEDKENEKNNPLALQQIIGRCGGGTKGSNALPC